MADITIRRWSSDEDTDIYDEMLDLLEASIEGTSDEREAIWRDPNATFEGEMTQSVWDRFEQAVIAGSAMGPTAVENIANKFIARVQWVIIPGGGN